MSEFLPRCGKAKFIFQRGRDLHLLWQPFASWGGFDEINRKIPMKTLHFVAAAALALAFAGPSVAQQADGKTIQQRNKEIVLDFYEKALNNKDFDAASVYLGTYKQHNPNAADGPEGLKGFLAFLKEKFPQSHSEIKQVFTDGDYVILHVHAVREPDTRGNAIVDIFRLKDGKIEEHWDAVQPIPEKSANTNTMF
jgi:predicted SnoaL-like aldol condensation-catalyzing enzyme